MLCIPVRKHDKISYLAVPLGYRMWQKRKTCKTRTKTIHRWRFCTVRWKDWWLLYGCTPCTYKSFRSQRSPRVCHISYCAMKLLPYVDNEFADYKDKSVQEFRFVISEGVRKQIFFTGFVQNIETQIKSISLIKAIKQAFRKHGYHL